MHSRGTTGSAPLALGPRQSPVSTRAPDAAFDSHSLGTSANRASYSRARMGPASRNASSSPTTMAQPPHPAPVSRAPCTPGSAIARSTTQSSSGREHSYRSRSDSCEPTNSSREMR